MKSLGKARCTNWGEQEVGVQFQQVGDINQFHRLLDEFKTVFLERQWHNYGWWVLPKRKLSDLETFCRKRGLTIMWTQKPSKNDEKG